MVNQKKKLKTKKNNNCKHLFLVSKENSLLPEQCESLGFDKTKKMREISI